jgi:hypothetical protein
MDCRDYRGPTPQGIWWTTTRRRLTETAQFTSFNIRTATRHQSRFRQLTCEENLQFITVEVCVRRRPPKFAAEQKSPGCSFQPWKVSHAAAVPPVGCCQVRRRKLACEPMQLANPSLAVPFAAPSWGRTYEARGRPLDHHLLESTIVASLDGQECRAGCIARIIMWGVHEISDAR